MWAGLHDHADAVKTLLAKGANPRIKSKTEKTAAEIAKDPAIIEILQAAAK
jgi:ankyrin repeat protein